MQDENMSDIMDYVVEILIKVLKDAGHSWVVVKRDLVIYDQCRGGFWQMECLKLGS